MFSDPLPPNFIIIVIIIVIVIMIREGGVDDLRQILQSNPLTIDSFVTRLHRLCIDQIHKYKCTNYNNDTNY